MTEIIFGIGLLLILLLLGWGLTYTIASIIADYMASKEAARFKQSLRLAIKNSQPSWSQVKIIANAGPLSKRRLSKILKELLAMALSGEDEYLKGHVNLIADYIDADVQEEPFEDMPQEIRIHLERLKDQLPNSPELVEALVEHLRETKIENVRQKKRQNIINLLSFVIGLIGLIIGLISAFKPARQ